MDDYYDNSYNIRLTINTLLTRVLHLALRSLSMLFSMYGHSCHEYRRFCNVIETNLLIENK